MRGKTIPGYRFPAVVEFRACAEISMAAMTQMLSLDHQANVEGRCLMSNSSQIITGPTLRQFATIVDDEDLIVTSKLGPSTLSRVRFKVIDYPAAPSERTEFIRDKVLQEFPIVASVLGSMLEQCILDQAKAVENLLRM
jgi:hypothetical protein